MPTRFDCEDAPNDYMEMPCQCDCGKWFDLNDGYSSRLIGSNKVICGECSGLQDAIVGIRNQIDELETYGNKKREVANLKKKLASLNDDPDNFYS